MGGADVVLPARDEHLEVIALLLALLLALFGAGCFMFGYEVGCSHQRALSRATQLIEHVEQKHLRVVRDDPKDAA